MDYHYKAFISYRHFTPDQEIAKKLHMYIENYTVPSKLKKKLGIRRMGRVFRDQEELPLSANLGDDIHAALEQSEWLICICSPRYLESRWCMEELRYFLSLGRRDHVLTVLAEGEPDTAFPDSLRTIETDGKTIEVEPLAADVRAGFLGDMLKKLKEEKLRILAPMLGVSFDDLKQRAKQRRARRIASAAAAVILLLSGFLGYSLWKNAEITGERNRTMIAQSRFLANEADLMLEKGSDRILAMMLAREALPEDCEHPDRPVTDEALCALRSSLISGLNTDMYISVTDLDLPIRGFGSDGTQLVVLSDQAKDYLGCFNLENGTSEDFSLKLKERPYFAMFSPDLQRIIYADVKGIHQANRDGNGFRVTDHEIYYSEKAYSFAVSEGWNSIAFSNTDYNISMLAPGSDRFATTQKTYIGRLTAYYSGTSDSEGTSDGKYLTWFPGERDDGVLDMIKISDEDVPAEDLILHRYFVSGDPDPGETDQNRDIVQHYTSSYDGKLIFGRAPKVLYYWNTFTEEQIGAVSSDAFDGAGLAEILSSSTDSRIAVITEKRQLFVYNYENGETTRMRSEEYGIDSAAFSTDGEHLLCADTENNTALIFQASTGFLLQKIPVDFGLTGAAFVKRDLRGNGLDDRYILLTGENRSRLLKLDEAASSEILCAIPENMVYHEEEAVLSPDGNQAWFFTWTSAHNRLNVYDFTTGDLSVILEFKDNTSMIYCHGLSRIGDRYVVLSGEDEETGRAILNVYDIRTHELVRALHPDMEKTGGMRIACQNDRYAVYCTTITDQGKCIVLDAETAEIVFADATLPAEEYIFRLEGRYLFILNDKGNKLMCPPVDLTLPPQEINYKREWFHGIFENAGIPGFSGRISAWRTGEQTCVMDLENGRETMLDLAAKAEAYLSADRKGLILQEDGKDGVWFLYDGKGLTPYEPSWAELHPETENPKEYLFGDRWVYLQDGALYDSETGLKQIDLYDNRILVSDMACDGSGLLIRKDGKGDLWLIRCPDGNTLLRIAGEILQGRELNREERKRYFIE